MGTDLYVGGRWRPSSAPPLVVRSPHDRSVVGEAGQATTADVDEAVSAAATAFESGAWSRRPAAERIEVLERLLPLYAERSDELATTISVGSSRVDLQACKLEYSIVSPK